MAAPFVAIIDYQAGNLRSVQKALEKVGARAIITADPRRIEEASGLVFPGQGAWDPAVQALERRGLINLLRGYVEAGRPFLGVCLGLQLLMERSEEGSLPGLGVLPGSVRRLPPGIKVPHMGWNQVRLQKPHPLFDGIPDGSYFYFVHSYYASPVDPSAVLGVTEYGLPFCSAVAQGDLVAVQFHPEKSGQMGLRLYGNFVRLVEERVGVRAWS